MVTKAVTYLKNHGKEKAFNEFCNTQGLFRKGELYVFVIDMKADILAHGSKRKMIGKGSFDLTDADGKNFLKEIEKKDYPLDPTESFGQNDLQLAETINIMKDLLLFLSETNQAQPAAVNQ